MKFRNVSTEVEENVEVDTSAIDEALEKYDSFMMPHTELKSRDLDLPVLTPIQMSLFFQTAINRRDSIYFGENNIFLNKLIYNSRNYGYNNFKFDNPRDCKTYDLFRSLDSELNKPISITFNGNSGEDFAKDSKDSTYNLNGTFNEYFGDGSSRCTYNIKVNIEKYFSHFNFNNTYNFFKKIKTLGVKEGGTCVRNCTFNIYEGIDRIIWIPLEPLEEEGETFRDCKFRTQDLETYEKLVSSFREFKCGSYDSKNKWHEQRSDYFKQDNTIIKEAFFLGYGKDDLCSTAYNKIHLIK